MIDVVLITSCIDSSHIYNLLHSINRSNVYVNALIIVVNQTEDSIFLDSNGCNEFCFLEKRKGNLDLLNSSSARNVALDYLYSRNLNFRYVCFPDDDTTYDMIFFQSLYRSISEGIDFNFIFDVYCSQTREHFHRIKYNEGRVLGRSDYKYVGAVNILINSRTLSFTGYFDERFGVNAKYGAGEDGDFFLRAQRFEEFFYTKKLYNYHPPRIDYSKLDVKKHRKKLISYSKGVVALLAHHGMFLEALTLMLRALGGCFFHLFRFRLRLAFIYFELFFVRGIYFFSFFIKGL